MSALESENSLWLGLKWGCGIVSVILIILLAGFYLFMRFRANQQYGGLMTPERYEKMHRYFSEPVKIPPAWIAEPAYPPALLQEWNRIESLYHEHDGEDMIDLSPLAIVQDGVTPQSFIWEDFLDNLESIEPFTDALTAYVTRPDYVLDANPQTPNGLRDATIVLTSCKILCMRAYVLAKCGRWKGAFASNLAAHHMAKRNAGLAGNTHFAAITIQRTAAECTQNLAMRCTEADIMKDALRELGELDSRVNLACLKDEVLLDAVIRLREGKKKGFQIGFTQERPAGYYFRKMFECQEWLAQRSGRIAPSGLRHRWNRFEILLGVRPDPVIFHFLGTCGRIGLRSTPEKCSTAQFQLARLMLANTLMILESGEFPEGADDFVPVWFEKAPEDPFSGKSFLWNAERMFFYSVGPDGKDDAGIIVYDSRKGDRTAKGDVVPDAIQKRLKRHGITR